MNTTIATKPQRVALKPFSMFSLPRLGPTVRSSMISIGAASAPARKSSATSAASVVLMRPEICTPRRRALSPLALLDEQAPHPLAGALARPFREDDGDPADREGQGRSEPPAR